MNHRDKTTEYSRLSQFGLTWRHLTENRGEELLTSYQEAFLAKTSVLPEKVKASQGPDRGFGRKCSGSFAKLIPGMSGWRTHQLSLLEGLEPFSKTWPKWGMMRTGECWEVSILEMYPTAKEYGFSLLRPTAQCWRAWTFKKLSSLVRKNHADGNLQEQSARCFRKMITPESNEILMRWPEGWTDLKPLEMDKFQKWINSHGKF